MGVLDVYLYIYIYMIRHFFETDSEIFWTLIFLVVLVVVYCWFLSILSVRCLLGGAGRLIKSRKTKELAWIGGKFSLDGWKFSLAGSFLWMAFFFHPLVVLLLLDTFAPPFSIRLDSSLRLSQNLTSHHIPTLIILPFFFNCL